MIRALLVDAGGVLFNNINEETSFIRDIARRYAVDESRLLGAVLSSAHTYESGACHAHDVLRGLLEEAGSPFADIFDAEWVDRLYAANLRYYSANVVELAEVARARPELTLVLANNEAEHWDHLKNQRHDHYRLFDHLCSSWRVGQVKPSAEYFAATLDRCGVEPREALMVDDRTTVIAAARDLGMRTLHVSSPEVLRTRLRETVENLVPSARS
ncbi:HAD-IA family hydrolase [Streptomyces noboritoensis]|uniref:HAD-IA family hydrolase n=1 Tax=Streptomyces noboritoensis TaxID=67337 RepID=A0ABV6TIS4_9ACTN